MAETSDRFRRAMNELVRLEGFEYTNVAWDNGGPTKFGITLDLLQRVRKNPSLTAFDVQRLTLPEAVEIYHAVYWYPWMDDPEVPEYLAHWVFFNDVNQSFGEAIEQAQMSAGAIGDGRVGPKSIAAFKAVSPRTFLANASKLREKRDRTLADYPKARDGWLRRLTLSLIHCAKLAPETAALDVIP